MSPLQLCPWCCGIPRWDHCKNKLQEPTSVCCWGQNTIVREIYFDRREGQKQWLCSSCLTADQDLSSTELAVVNDQVNFSSVSTTQIALLSISMSSLNSFSSQNNLYLQNVWLAQMPGNHKQGIGVEVALCTCTSMDHSWHHAILESAFQKKKIDKALKKGSGGIWLIYKPEPSFMALGIF